VEGGEWKGEGMHPSVFLPPSPFHLPPFKKNAPAHLAGAMISSLA
jgi:hypothetical protein